MPDASASDRIKTNDSIDQPSYRGAGTRSTFMGGNSLARKRRQTARSIAVQWQREVNA